MSYGFLSKESVDLREESLLIDEALKEDSKGIRESIIRVDKEIKREEEIRALAAEDGDLRENAGFQTADANIARLNVEMRDLHVKAADYASFNFADDYEPSGFIGTGTTVLLHDEASRESIVIKLVPPGLGNASIRAISTGSPVGAAILGKGAGDVVTVTTQAKTIDYKIQEIF